MDEQKKLPKFKIYFLFQFQLTTVPDPQFSPFSGVHQLQPDQPLMLSGQWLSQAAEPGEYWIGIGTEKCPVSTMEWTPTVFMFIPSFLPRFSYLNRTASSAAHRPSSRFQRTMRAWKCPTAVRLWSSALAEPVRRLAHLNMRAAIPMDH
jgi:hypothetical protein